MAIFEVDPSKAKWVEKIIDLYVVALIIVTFVTVYLFQTGASIVIIYATILLGLVFVGWVFFSHYIIEFIDKGEREA